MDAAEKIKWVKHLKATGHAAFLILKMTWLTIWTMYQIALGIFLIALVYGFLKVADYFSFWDIRLLAKEPPKTTAFIESEKSRILDSLHRVGVAPPDSLIQWKWIPLDSIPKVIQEVALVAEDAKFYEHQGFDLENIEYAMVANHQAGKKARGASTITQQVAKNLYLSKDKEMTRKAREAIITLLLEHYVSKDRILEIYLNIAQFDEGVFGIRSACRHYLNKEPAALTQEEAINVICLLPSPSKWNFKRPNMAYLQHKRLVSRNYAMFKGLKMTGDSTATNWQSQALSTLAESLSEEQWKVLRSKPVVESSGDSSNPPDETTAAGDASPTPTLRTAPAALGGHGARKLRTF